MNNNILGMLVIPKEETSLWRMYQETYTHIFFLLALVKKGIVICREQRGTQAASLQPCFSNTQRERLCTLSNTAYNAQRFIPNKTLGSQVLPRDVEGRWRQAMELSPLWGNYLQRQAKRYRQPWHHKSPWDCFLCADLSGVRKWSLVRLQSLAHPIDAGGFTEGCVLEQTYACWWLVWWLSSPLLSCWQSAPKEPPLPQGPLSFCTHTYLRCEPASGCCCLMGLCPPAGPPVLPPAGWGPAPGSRYTSSSAGTGGSAGTLPGARPAVPRFDAAPPSSGGRQERRCEWVWCAGTCWHVAVY